MFLLSLGGLRPLCVRRAGCWEMFDGEIRALGGPQSEICGVTCAGAPSPLANLAAAARSSDDFPEITMSCFLSSVIGPLSSLPPSPAFQLHLRYFQNQQTLSPGRHRRTSWWLFFSTAAGILITFPLKKCIWLLWFCVRANLLLFSSHKGLIMVRGRF